MKTLPLPSRSTLPPPDAEALIEEARRLRRRRLRRGSLAGAILLGAGGLGLWGLTSAGGSRRPPTPPKVPAATPVSAAQLRSFVSSAQKGTQGDFLATYSMTTKTRTINHSRVSVAQIGKSYTYSATPGIWGPASGTPAEVFASPLGIVGVAESTAPQSGFYSCSPAGAPTACMALQVAMGGTAQLQGQYPPNELFWTLQNVASFVAMPNTLIERMGKLEAYSATRQVAGQKDNCLVFRANKLKLATFCLGRHDLISYMAMNPALQSAEGGTFIAGTLEHYSSAVPNKFLELPYPPSAQSN